MGSALGGAVRLNDDPVFDWLHRHHPAGSDLFQGYAERRVLTPDERLVDMMVRAASAAVREAGIEARSLDLVIGYASFGTWLTPNDLGEVARVLGVGPSTAIMALNDEFATFNHSLVVADALIRAGRVGRALVVVGSDWTRYVDYHTPPSISAGDGAGAVVVTSSDDAGSWTLVDDASTYALEYWGGMYTAPDPDGSQNRFGPPVFHLGPEGVAAFEHFAGTAPAQLTATLLGRHGVEPAALATICHQASSVLLDQWREAIGPARFVETLRTYANITAATIPVNLAEFAATIAEPNLALIALGPEASTNVVLLSRG